MKKSKRPLAWVFLAVIIITAAAYFVERIDTPSLEGVSNRSQRTTLSEEEILLDRLSELEKHIPKLGAEAHRHKELFSVYISSTLQVEEPPYGLEPEMSATRTTWRKNLHSLEGEELYAYASTIDTPDNKIKSLYPRVSKLRKEITV